jgi:DNA adenine methylase
MAYLGGKAKGAEHIFEILNSPKFDNFDYIEPFVGYAHILRRVKNKKSYKASDNNEYLITLLQHIQKTKGKHPEITLEEYHKLKQHPEKNLLRAAYAAFTYSYNGKFFGGYTEKAHGRNYPEERKAYYDKLHDNEIFKKTSLQHTSYTKYMGVKGKLIYCDPPYEDTTEYHSGFDSSKFWEDMRTLSKDNYVFISEYNAPSDFICVKQKTKRQSVAGRGATRKKQEKVFTHESKKDDPIIKSLLLQKSFKCKSKRGTRKIKK